MFDFNAHAALANHKNDVQEAVNKAMKKAPMGKFLVCITKAKDVLVLPEYSANVRDDITGIVFDTVDGYRVTNRKGAM